MKGVGERKWKRLKGGSRMIDVDRVEGLKGGGGGRERGISEREVDEVRRERVDWVE